LAISPTLPPVAPTGQPSLDLNGSSDAETIELDFSGVAVLTPSFAEEFVIGLLDRYPGRVHLRNMENATVRTTFDFLGRQWPEQMNTVTSAA
jgi:hypothetical protein